MLKKKFFAKALAFAMVTGLMATSVPTSFISQPIQAFADTTATSKVTISDVDYAKFTVDLITTEKIAFLEVVKKNKDGSYKTASTYSFLVPAAGTVTVDLSFLKPTTTLYIRAYGSDGVRSAVKEIAAQGDKLSLKFTLKDTVEKCFSGKKGKTALTEIPTADLAKYEFKSLYGSTWKTMENANLTIDTLKNLSVTGGTLLVRVAGDTTNAEKTKQHLPGPEAKVKIPVAPKAPKVSIDYVKGIIAFPKNVKATTKPESTTDSDWKDVSGKMEVADVRKAMLTSGSTDDGAAKSIYVQTPATGKKSASSVTLLSLPATIKFKTSTKWTEDPNTKAISGAIEMETDDKSKVSGTTVVDSKDDTKATAQLKPEGASFDFSIDGGKTWKTVKAGGIFTVDQAKDTNVTVRKSGDKKTETFPSESITIKISKYVKPTTSPN